MSVGGWILWLYLYLSKLYLLAQNSFNAVRVINVFHLVTNSVIVLLPSLPLPSPIVPLLEHLRHVLVDGPVRAFTRSTFVSRQLQKVFLDNKSLMYILSGSTLMKHSFRERLCLMEFCQPCLLVE